MPMTYNPQGFAPMFGIPGPCLLVSATVLLALSGPAHAADPAAAASATTGSSDDTRIICRKTAEVGSLVKRKKECFTKAEWDKIADAHQRGARKLMDGLTERYSCQPDPTDPNAPPC